MNNQEDLVEIIREHLKPIFQSYDKDGNSSLQKGQLRNLLADNLGVSAQSITEDQLNWHFDKIDENKDGHITFNQYFNHFFQSRAKTAKKSEGNEDELIDIKQFKRLMEDTFRPINVAITQEMVQWNFKKIDTDNSGRISFKQFLQFIKKYNK